MNPKPAASEAKIQLRRKMRQWRQNLSAQQQNTAALELSRNITQWPAFREARHIAGYLAQDGELSLEHLFRHCWQDHKLTYLPILRPLPPNRLWFAPYTQHSALHLNRYRIPEPNFQLSALIPPSRLDLVLFPLVAFDVLGGRLGMGGGFYDRTFSHLTETNRRPLFVGIAHDEQCVETLPNDPWDIPLDAVFTPSQCYLF
jgi:5-formyltetrahydrofolate cyclo-ligase